MTLREDVSHKSPEKNLAIPGHLQGVSDAEWRRPFLGPLGEVYPDPCCPSLDPTGAGAKVAPTSRETLPFCCGPGDAGVAVSACDLGVPEI